MREKARKGCEVLLSTCAAAKPNDTVLIITDDSSYEIGSTLYEYIRMHNEVSLIITTPRNTHGSAPTDTVAAAMKCSDIIFSATTFSLFNTPARIEACAAGARFINVADYSIEMLEAGCLFVDFTKTRELIDTVASMIVGKRCTLTTPLGTNIIASIAGRKAICGYGIANKPGMAASPPDIETAIGPADGSAEGILVIDGSIPMPGLGVIEEPITLKVEKGYVTNISGGREARFLEESLFLMNDPRVYLVGEIGFGMNTGASISGRMLEDEGVHGTVHIGIGNNLSYGGSNATPSHIDLVMKCPTYIVDGRTVCSDGEYRFEK